ncbi:hypothetical protein EHRUM2_09280 [Ehrlichia ruminantium]|uniref:Uncharacterized protein n=1 Tax=Ehrlichia ruminantium TaxID=779 RepID=A0A170S712_EHRRU|nr:hypothetical protein EHRUM2_09280 [Ehrlichia ruminantium]
MALTNNFGFQEMINEVYIDLKQSTDIKYVIKNNTHNAAIQH